MKIRVADQEILLLPQKAVFLLETRCLLISDLHLGKAMHFRKSGIAMPTGADGKDLEVLRHLISMYAPLEVMFLGDLFHSHENVEWTIFQEFMEAHPAVDFTLVPGNHDRYATKFREKTVLRLLPDCYTRGPFLFTHAPLGEVPVDCYNFCGHLHPGVQLAGKARMRLTLPCFWFGLKTAVLPAYGQLTGLSIIKPAPADRIIVIADGNCVEL